MKYSFINLDKCVERREFVVDNFSKFSHKEKIINRISAVDIDYVYKHNISGKLKPNEKACYLSHRKAIQSSLDYEDHVFIAEDDVLFCAKSTEVIETSIGNIDSQAWDIIYTDLCVQHIHLMASFFSKRRQYEVDNKIELLDLSQMIFSSATAYIINRSSKQKILDLLSKEDLNFPFDLILRKLILNQKINGFLMFPFPTSLSQYAENSQIQADDDLIADLIFNSYRRLVWLDRDINAVLSTINQIDNSIYDEDSDAFCALLRALMSKKIKTK